MKQSEKLGALASDLCDALPDSEVDLKLHIATLGMFHFENITIEQISPRPIPMTYYGKAFHAAYLSVFVGYSGRVSYHREFLAKEVARAGGVLSPVKRIERPIATMPQPTPRFPYDNGHTPRDGKE